MACGVDDFDFRQIVHNQSARALAERTVIFTDCVETSDRRLLRDVPVTRKIIYNRETFHLAIDDLEAETELGVALKWNWHVKNKPKRTALLVIASWHSIYALQILKLKSCLEEEDWLRLGQNLLGNINVTKIGYHVLGGWRTLLSTVPILQSCFVQEPNFVDLKILEQEMETGLPDVFSSLQTYDDEALGLGRIAMACLGSSLNPTQVHCHIDWEYFWLNEGQVYQAAVDAFVLLPLHAEMCKIFYKHWEGDVNEYMSISCDEMLKRSRHNMEGKIEVDEVKLVVDNMFSGLGRYLFHMGLDVVTLNKKADHMDCVKISQKENRVIVTCGYVYRMVYSLVPEGMCINLQKNWRHVDSTAYIFEMLNVRL